MPDQAKKFQTHRAAQFYTAAELTRRGYLVTLTNINAKEQDICVVSPKGQKYCIDVRGLASSNFWLINPSCYQRKLRLEARTKSPTFSSNP